MPQQTRFYSIDDLSHLPKPSWLIEGLFEAKSLVMLAGPPGSLKSFMAIDWMMCLAMGRQWNDRPTAETKVLYVLGEGRSSLLKRIETWCRYHKVTQTEREKLVKNFRVTFDVPQMALKPSVDNMLSGLTDGEFKPGLVCIDTFNRSFVGLDENSQKDTGLWIEQAERLRDLGYCVVIVHHTAKNTEFGHKFRGSSVILGAMDTAMLQVREGESAVKLKITKQKDHDEGPPMDFNRLIIKYDGDDEGSVVLTPTVFLDERFSVEHDGIETMAKRLLDDKSFGTDKERAVILAQEFGLSTAAAQVRLTRLKKDKPISPNYTSSENHVIEGAPVIVQPIETRGLTGNYTF